VRIRPQGAQVDGQDKNEFRYAHHPALELTRLPPIKGATAGVAELLPGATRVLSEGTVVAFTCDGSSRAMVMTTPADFEDFAVVTIAVLLHHRVRVKRRS
jgi:hypothetical protein